MYSQIIIFASLVAMIATVPIVPKMSTNKLSNSVVKATEVTTSASTANKERNWLLTKAWLIDNINRLRHEFNELERDYSHHVESSDTMKQMKDKKTVEEMATLRADHTVLSQQQKQIIQLIKRSQLYSTGPYVSKHQMMATTTQSPKKSHKKRHSNFTHFVKKEQSFEDQTKHNMSEVFAEMSALHDITINIFEDLMDIQKKVNQKIDKQS